MKNKAVLLVLVLVLAMSTLYAVEFIMPVAQSSKIWKVGPGYDFATIQEAINNESVSEGDIIEVAPLETPFYEHVVVNKSLTIRKFTDFAERPIIDGNGTDTVVNITASNVRIFNFTIQNGDRGLYLFRTSASNIIADNVITSNGYGVYISRSSGNTLRNNNMSGNQWNFGVGGYILSDFIQDIDKTNKVNDRPIYYLVNQTDEIINQWDNAGYVAVVNSTDITVKDLTLTRNAEGVLFAYTNNSVIQNVITSYNRAGIELLKSNGNKIKGATVSNNYDGILSSYSSNNTINSSIVSSNARFGISLYDSSNETVNGNIVSHNSIGVVLDKSNNNTIVGNNITNNKYGIFLNASNGSRLYRNNFIDNEYQVAPESPPINEWDNGREGNYWSDYTGLDDGSDGRVAGDGIGDTLLPAPDGDPVYAPGEARVDNYPLMEPWSVEKAFSVFRYTDRDEYSVTTFSNSTRASLGWSRELRQISFIITSGTKESINITIPRDWLEGPFEVKLNGVPIIPDIRQDMDYSYLFFTYTPNTYTVVIIGTRVLGYRSGDLNDDGFVDIYDAITLANYFGGEDS